MWEPAEDGGGLAGAEDGDPQNAPVMARHPSPPHKAPPLPGSSKPPPAAKGRPGGAGAHKISRKWSDVEQEQLLSSIQALCGGDHDSINWAEVAKAVPSRTGKQCREKWRNDLRPELSKEPWSPREEYVLAW